MDEITDIYQAHVGLLRGRARRILNDVAAAEDVVHESFIRLLAHLSQGGDVKHVAAFLYTTVTHASLNRLRDSKRRHELLEQQVAPAVATNQNSPQLDDQMTMKQILSEAPEQEAQVAAHYYFGELEQEEIATLLGMPRRTVANHLERFRQFARDRLTLTAKEAR